MAVGTDAVDTAERLCRDGTKVLPNSTFFGGEMAFQRERWNHALLHNNTVLALQKLSQWEGRTMVTLPVRLRETRTRGRATARHRTTSGACRCGRRVALCPPPPGPGCYAAFARFAFSHSLASLTQSTSTSFSP
jgi:hypothetical protein